MKTILQYLMLAALVPLSVCAEDGARLPPEESRADWTELKEKKFEDWTIQNFLGWDVPSDGGSKVFFFVSGSGERFDVMAANPSYWKAKDRKEARQVFFLIHESGFYRIEPASDEERNIIEKLEKAIPTLSGTGKTDPKLLNSLIERLKSREPMFKPKS